MKKARKSNPQPCQRCGHTKSQHVNHGAFGAGRCKHCTCPRFNAGRQKNPPALKLKKWIRLPNGAGSIRIRRQGRGRVIEYKSPGGK